MGDGEGCLEDAAHVPAERKPPVARPPADDGGFDLRWLIVGGVVAAGATGAVVTRRRFLGMSALVASSLAVPAVGRTRAASAQGDPGEAPRPNIVWFRSEDNSAEFIGAYGNPLARTPNLDRLAAGGVRFDRFFTTSPVCAPTKLGWATGMYEAGLGPGHNMRAQGRRPEVAVGFATWLRDAGYWTTTSGNVDYNTDLAGVDGFDDEEGDWQAGVEAGKPFLALLGSSTTHEFNLPGSKPEATDPADVELPAYLPDDPVLRRDRATYHDLVARMDGEVGELRAELERRGVAEDTIVIYSSDHGGVLPRSKRFCYDSGLHAPLVAYFPPRWQHLAPSGPGTVVETPVSSIDAAPTMLRLAGLDVPEHFQGQPFAGTSCGPRRYAFSNRNRMDEAIDFVRSARDERYRYIRNYMPHLPWGQHIDFMWKQAGYRRWEQLHLAEDLPEVQDRFWREKPYEELYDLEADPDEVTNLVDDPTRRARLDDLRAALDAHMVAINDNGFIPEGSDAEGYDQSREPGAYPLARLMELGARAAQRDPKHLPALLDALGDENEIVRYWGALGCSMLGDRAASAADDLATHMADPAEARWVRVQCADALARTGTTGPAVAYLGGVAANEAEPMPTRVQAVQSLMLLGPSAIAGRDGLAAAAVTADEYVKAAGAHALQVVDGTYAPVP